MTVGDETIQAWVRLVRAYTRAMAEIEGRLKAAGLPPLAWYDVLLELERGGGLRPRDLQARLLLPQSNVSRLLDRMQAKGSIERTSCEDDRRGQSVTITAAGRRLRRRMWPVYAAAIEAAVGARLQAGEAHELAVLLGRLSIPP